MEPNPDSSGAKPEHAIIKKTEASNEYKFSIPYLTNLKSSPTCNKCPELNKKKGTLDGYKWCERYQRYTKPEHVGC